MSEEELRKEVEQLREEVERLKKQGAKENNYSKEEDKDISRRDFLKKAGLGVAGLGALAMTPASAQSVIQSHPVSELVVNDDIDLGGQHSIVDAKNVQTDTINGTPVDQLGGSGGVVHFGDGSDGSVTDSSESDNSEIERSGILQTTSYTLESGTTLNVPEGEGILAIYATEKITINGTIDAEGAGGVGGQGGDDHNAGDGEDGAMFPRQKGGKGGYNRFCRGGRGGDGGTGDILGYREKFLAAGNPMYAIYNANAIGPGAGGGGGGHTVDSAESGWAKRGEYPGGGEQGDEVDTNAFSSNIKGGDGGNGGGAVYLFAPEVEINGTINAGGEDGSRGESRHNDTYDSTYYGGGGGAGSGGAVLVMAKNLVENSPSYDISGGSGAEGGADGEDGKLVKIEL